MLTQPRHPPPSPDMCRARKPPGPLAQQTQQLCSSREDNQDDFRLHKETGAGQLAFMHEEHSDNIFPNLASLRQWYDQKFSKLSLTSKEEESPFPHQHWQPLGAKPWPRAELLTRHLHSKSLAHNNPGRWGSGTYLGVRISLYCSFSTRVVAATDIGMTILLISNELSPLLLLGCCNMKTRTT